MSFYTSSRSKNTSLFIIKMEIKVSLLPLLKIYSWLLRLLNCDIYFIDVFLKGIIIRFGTNNLGNERFSRKSQIKPRSSSTPNHFFNAKHNPKKPNFLKFGLKKVKLNICLISTLFSFFNIDPEQIPHTTLITIQGYLSKRSSI